MTRASDKNTRNQTLVLPTPELREILAVGRMTAPAPDRSNTYKCASAREGHDQNQPAVTNEEGRTQEARKQSTVLHTHSSAYWSP